MLQSAASSPDILLSSAKPFPASPIDEGAPDPAALIHLHR
jgi:hypothetical protein